MGGGVGGWAAKGDVVMGRRGVRVRRGGGRAVTATNQRVVCACVLGALGAAHCNVTDRVGKVRRVVL